MSAFVEYYFDHLETQPNDEREANLFEQLPHLLTHVAQSSPYYQQALSGIELGSINSRQALTQLPVLRKSALMSLQTDDSVLAGIEPGFDEIDRLFISPGPICEPESNQEDWWRMGRAFHAAGFEAGDRVQNCFSYHMTPGGLMMDSGARACGCVVIPAGPGSTEQQLAVNARLRPRGYCGTPSFLKILIDKAKACGQILSFEVALVSGEAVTEPLKQAFAEAGIRVHQAYATADLGLIAYESEPGQGLVVAEQILVEILRPGSGEPVAEGEVGEVVVTNFNLEYPLIRFATGDLSSVLPQASLCGRTNLRLRGWQGRADQSTKVKGLFVHPQQLEQIRRRHPELIKLRLIVTHEGGNDKMLLRCQHSGAGFDASAIAETLKAVTKLSGEVISTSDIADDGVVIEDRR